MQHGDTVEDVYCTACELGLRPSMPGSMSALTHFKPYESSFETSFGHRFSITTSATTAAAMIPMPNHMTRVWSNNSPWMQTAAPASAAKVASAAGAILHSTRTMTFSRTVRRLRAICRGSPRHFDPGAAEGAEVTFVAGSVRLELCGVASLALRCGLTVRCISAQMRWKPSSDMLLNLRESTTCERCHRYRLIGYRDPPRVVPDSANDAQADLSAIALK
jgi:hypothetical protein